MSGIFVATIFRRNKFRDISVFARAETPWQISLVPHISVETAKFCQKLRHCFRPNNEETRAQLRWQWILILLKMVQIYYNEVLLIPQNLLLPKI